MDVQAQIAQIFENALNEIHRLEGLTDDLLQTHQRLVTAVIKKLSGRALHSNPQSAQDQVLCALDKCRTTIESYLQKDIETAVGIPLNDDVADFRTLDMRRGDPKTPGQAFSKFRKGMAERSFALEYHEWELEAFGSSTLSELRNDPTLESNKIAGTVVSFFEARYKTTIQSNGTSGRAIRHGTRLLLLEHLTGSCSVSAILFFSYGALRRVKNAEIMALSNKLRSVDWLTKLLKISDNWFKQCFQKYNAPLNRKRRLGATDGDPTPKRIRQVEGSVPASSPAVFTEQATPETNSAIPGTAAPQTESAAVETTALEMESTPIATAGHPTLTTKASDITSAQTDHVDVAHVIPTSRSLGQVLGSASGATAEVPTQCKALEAKLREDNIHQVGDSLLDGLMSPGRMVESWDEWFAQFTSGSI